MSFGRHVTRIYFTESWNYKSMQLGLFYNVYAESVTLFNKLGWIPFYEQSKVNKCAISCKRINGSLPGYLNDHLVLNNTQHNRSTRYASYNSICPYYKCETEGGRSFAVSSARLHSFIHSFMPVVLRTLLTSVSTEMSSKDKKEASRGSHPLEN